MRCSTCLTAMLLLSACLGRPIDAGLTGQPVDNLGNVGEPCIPSQEYSGEFPGFDVDEVVIDVGQRVDGGVVDSIRGPVVSPSCGDGNVCMVNHFQGRVTCPNGYCGGPSEHCDAPGGNPIAVPIRPQRVERPASDSVYCSCQCAGPDPQRSYCACPQGFECKQVMQPVSRLGDVETAGSYCVKTGTDFDPATGTGTLCGPAQSCAAPAPELLSAVPDIAVRSVVRLDRDLADPCLPVVERNATLQATCIVIEAFDSSDPAECNCQTLPGLLSASPEVIDPVLRNRYGCLCEMIQLGVSDTRLCLQEPNIPPTSRAGWCYVDELDLGGKSLTRGCPPTLRQAIRFVGMEEPRPGAVVHLRCQSHDTDLVSEPVGGCSANP